MSMANWANADELHSGMYELSTVPGNQLDYRKVYLVVEKHDVQGFFDNPFTAPAANNPDRDPTCRFLLKSSDNVHRGTSPASFKTGRLATRPSFICLICTRPFTNASGSALIASALVVGTPCGKPAYIFRVPFLTSFADRGPESA
ncbi:hypothetical protein CBA19CS91_37330 [Paraburkholderia hospita]|nr:hypothetical protein CBA19CS91_37330 [Paraburkholderia hospita]